MKEFASACALASALILSACGASSDPADIGGTVPSPTAPGMPPSVDGMIGNPDDLIPGPHVTGGTDGIGHFNKTPLEISSHEVAERLARALFGEPADDDLRESADQADLLTVGDVARFARGLLDDPRAETGVQRLYGTWLGTEAPPISRQIDDAYTPEVEAAFRGEATELGVEVALRGDGLLRTLLTTRAAFVNEASAPLYDVPGIVGEDLQLVELDNEMRAGLFTRGMFLTEHGRASGASPIYRGIGVRELLMCFAVPPPPASVNTSLPDVPEEMTPRQALEAHTIEPSCAACHSLLDPIGFGFDVFDGAGRYREQIAGLPIDTQIEVRGQADSAGTYAGPAELMDALADSAEVQRCIAQRWGNTLLGVEYPGDLAPTVLDGFVQRATTVDGFSLRELVIAIVQSPEYLAP